LAYIIAGDTVACRVQRDTNFFEINSPNQSSITIIVIVINFSTLNSSSLPSSKKLVGLRLV